MFEFLSALQVMFRVVLALIKRAKLTPSDGLGAAKKLKDVRSNRYYKKSIREIHALNTCSKYMLLIRTLILKLYSTFRFGIRYASSDRV
jgi:hypothetical protein